MIAINNYCTAASKNVGNISKGFIFVRHLVFVSGDFNLIIDMIYDKRPTFSKSTWKNMIWEKVGR